MRTKSDFERHCIKLFFEYKGYVAAISEKSATNYKYLSSKDKIQSKEEEEKEKNRIHYFAVGHKFKNLPFNSDIIFQKKLEKEDNNGINQERRKLKATEFETLSIDNFSLHKEIGKLIDNIRNLNSHYVHTFDLLRIEKDSKLYKFLLDSFKMSTLISFLESEENEGFTTKRIKQEAMPKKEKEELYKEYTITKNEQTKYIENINSKEFKEAHNIFIRKKFKYELKQNYREIDYKELIESILFFDVEKDFKWKLYDEDASHEVITIKAGRYISFIGAIFFLSMFLYKDEANILISGCKGFKDNNDKEKRNKREIMTFFSKKSSSQDYNCEEKNPIYFRDIIQYLNKYPTDWNKEQNLDIEKKDHLYEKLIDSIKSLEVERIFPKMSEDNKFKNKAVQFIFNQQNTKSENVLQKLLAGSNELTQEVKKHGEVYKERKIKEIETLKNRLKTKTFYTSYGRNQDRFMEIAIRFLAERNYFGKEAEFNMYRFFTTEEQNAHLNSLKEELKELLNKEKSNEEYKKKKKEYDGLKFHGGRVTQYCKYAEHIKKNPKWDDAFVIRNNSVQVKLKLDKDKNDFILSIQRPLMIYLLQDALNKTENNSSGTLIQRYYDYYKQDFEKVKITFDNLKENSENIEKEVITSLKKLLPKRAVNKIVKGQKISKSVVAYGRLLEKAREEEKKYNDRIEEKHSISDEAYIYYIRKNKGKQFKLQFIRKAWKIMYFREIYKSRVKEDKQGKHHKHYHITRDEYNDFCRYMFGMDMVPEYKEELERLLNAKGFLKDSKLIKIFNNSNNLDDFYKKTAHELNNWLIKLIKKKYENEEEEDNSMYDLNRYRYIQTPKEDIKPIPLYVNLSHFRDFLKNKEEEWKSTKVKGGIDFSALSNEIYLINSFYNIEEKNDRPKMYNKLNKAKLEDCLLYEVAIKYFEESGLGRNKKNKIKENVNSILTTTYTISINENDKNNAYNLKVPFNSLEKYVGIGAYDKRKKEENRFIPNIPKYLSFIKRIKEDEREKDSENNVEIVRKDTEQYLAVYEELKTYFDNIEKNSTPSLYINEVIKIQRHLMLEVSKYISVFLELERYYIDKDRIVITEGNRINLKEIVGLKEVIKNNDDRNRAFHFNFPKEKVYVDKLIDIETSLLKILSKLKEVKNFNEISYKEKEIYKRLLENAYSNLIPNPKEEENISPTENEQNSFLDYLKNKQETIIK